MLIARAWRTQKEGTIMKRIIGLALVAVGCMAWATIAAQTQSSSDAQSPEYLASYFTSPTVSQQQVTITARTGQRLVTLAVPIGVTLSVHLKKGEFTAPNEKTGEATFSGDVSIRTWPRSELVKDVGLRNQMMNAPQGQESRREPVVDLSRSAP
jgi:hypothetical protein